jgi:hypothetical protein
MHKARPLARPASRKNSHVVAPENQGRDRRLSRWFTREVARSGPWGRRVVARCQRQTNTSVKRGISTAGMRSIKVFRRLLFASTATVSASKTSSSTAVSPGARACARCTVLRRSSAVLLYCLMRRMWCTPATAMSASATASAMTIATTRRRGNQRSMRPRRDFPAADRVIFQSAVASEGGLEQRRKLLSALFGPPTYMSARRRPPWSRWGSRY